MKHKKGFSPEELIKTFLFMAIFISLIIFSYYRNLKIAITFFIVSFIILFTILITYKFYLRNKLLNSGIDIVDKMSGKEFENFLLIHFKYLGFKGNTTPGSHDYGADLVLYKNNMRYVIQAKRWDKKIGIDAIQQIVAAINYYGANKGIVITNNYFTKNAFILAYKNGIELWDRNKLIEIMSKSQGKNIANNVINNDSNIYAPVDDPENTQERLCPECGHKLIIKRGKYGPFWGCSNYPGCKYTQNL